MTIAAFAGHGALPSTAPRSPAGSSDAAPSGMAGFAELLERSDRPGAHGLATPAPGTGPEASAAAQPIPSSPIAPPSTDAVARPNDPTPAAPAHAFAAFGMFGHPGAVVEAAGKPPAEGMRLWGGRPIVRITPPSDGDGQLPAQPASHPTRPTPGRSFSVSGGGVRPPLHAPDSHSGGTAMQRANQVSEEPGDLAAEDAVEPAETIRPSRARSQMIAAQAAQDPAPVSLSVSGENGALEIIARAGEGDPDEREILRSALAEIAGEHGFSLTRFHLDGSTVTPPPFQAD